jgi:hypothetical protein
MTEVSPHLSASTLDRRALGDLGPDETEAAEAHLSSCAACRERLAEQQQSFRKFEQFVLPAVLPQLRARRSFAWRWLWTVPAVAALAALLLVVPRAVPHDEIGVKGGPAFQTFVRRGTQVFSAVDGMLLEPGDDLRFVVQPAGLHYLLIVSRDGAGHLTVYYPFGGSQSSAVDPAGRDELPGSVKLDATPGEETLFALFSRQPLEAARVTERLGSGSDSSAAELGADSLLRLRFVKGTP